MLTIKHRSIAVVAAAVAALINISAVAPARAETMQVAVSYAGLDLASPNDVKVLDRRLRAAAARVCGPLEASQRYLVLSCRQNAVANARAALPARTLKLAAR